MTKTDLWTNAQVAEYFGVSESRARHILRNNGIKRVYGYPSAEVQAIHRPGQGARTDLRSARLDEQAEAQLADYRARGITEVTYGDRTMAPESAVALHRESMEKFLTHINRDEK